MVRNTYISFLQVAYVCDVIANDPQLAEGYNGLGISQVKVIIDQYICTILTQSEYLRSKWSICSHHSNIEWTPFSKLWKSRANVFITISATHKLKSKSRKVQGGLMMRGVAQRCPHPPMRCLYLKLQEPLRFWTMKMCVMALEHTIFMTLWSHWRRFVCRNLITFGSPHQGVFGVPECEAEVSFDIKVFLHYIKVFVFVFVFLNAR